MRLDIACGQNKTKGFKGIDLDGNADIRHDLFKFPWPIKASSVTEAVCNHFVEHIPHAHPGWDRDGWWLFWDEVYRVMKVGARITLTHPYVRNERAFWDPTHERFIHEMNYYYLNQEWRKSQNLDHYPVSCDFEVVTISVGIDDSMQLRSDQQQQHARMYYWNCVGDMTVILEKKA